MQQITVFSGPERRRRWREEDRLRILGEAFAPGACVANVARRHDVSTGLIYTWRRKLRRKLPGPARSPSALRAEVYPELVEGPGPTFAEAVVIDEPKLGAAASAVIVIDLPGGGRVSLAASTPPALAAAALKALK